MKDSGKKDTNFLKSFRNTVNIKQTGSETVEDDAVKREIGLPEDDVDYSRIDVEALDSSE